MSLHTVGNVVGAANASLNLHSLAYIFLKNFRMYANGFNGVKVPSGDFAVVASGVGGTAENPTIEFAVVYSETSSWQVATHYDPSDDNFNEAWGADNTSGYEYGSSTSSHEKRVSIAAEHLLLPPEQQIDLMKKWKAEEDAKKRERIRQEKMAVLRKQLSELENLNVKS